MRTVTLNPKQQRDVEILTRLEAGALDPKGASELLGVSPRQLRRLRVRFASRASAPSSTATRAALHPIAPIPLWLHGSWLWQVPMGSTKTLTSATSRIAWIKITGLPSGDPRWTVYSS